MTQIARQHRRPLWLGVLIAPWAAPFALALLSAAVDGDADLHASATFIEVFAFALVFGLPIAYVALAGAGIPLVLWLRRRGRLATWRVVSCAAPVGSTVLVLAFAAMGAKLAMTAQLGIGALMGVSVAIAFCAVCGIPWHAPRR
jgi:hypothetical protein